MSGNEVVISRLKELSDDDIDQLGSLVSQLSNSAKPISKESLIPLFNDDRCFVFVARRNPGSAILGMLTLVVFNIPTGIRAWIEDVVVDKDTRGMGIGKRLTMRAIEQAKNLGAVTVDLTSRPSRTAANSMYQALGFKLRETNVYRYG